MSQRAARAGLWLLAGCAFSNFLWCRGDHEAAACNAIGCVVLIILAVALEEDD